MNGAMVEMAPIGAIMLNVARGDIVGVLGASSAHGRHLGMGA